jgi:anti-anti-sigma factor
MYESVVTAPVSLTARNRGAFRAEALAALERLADAGPGARLVIDLAATQRVDSVGVGVLVVVQARAAERRQAVCLRNASEEVRVLLLMTGLADRFTIAPRA